MTSQLIAEPVRNTESRVGGKLAERVGLGPDRDRAENSLWINDQPALPLADWPRAVTYTGGKVVFDPQVMAEGEAYVFHFRGRILAAIRDKTDAIDILLIR